MKLENLNPLTWLRAGATVPAKPKNIPDVLTIEAEGDVSILEAAAGDEGKEEKVPTFSMVAYTGGKMRPLGFGVDVVADLKGVRIAAGKRPALYQHNADSPVGHFEAGDIVNDGKRIKASGVLSVDGAERQKLIQSSRDGFPWKASIGARYSWDDMEFIAADQSADVNGKKQRGPFYLVKAATIYEISFVTIAGDDSASAAVKATSSMEGSMKFEAWLQAKGWDINLLTAGQLGVLRASWEAELKASGQGDPADETPSAQDDPNKPPKNGNSRLNAGGDLSPGDGEDPIQQLRLNAAGEIKRQSTIASLFAGSRLDDAKRGELHAQAIEQNWSTDKVELEILRAGRSEIGAGGQFHIQSQKDRTSNNVLTAATSLAMGVPEEIVARGMSQDDMNLANEQRYRNVSLHSLMARTFLEANGYSYHGSQKSDEFLELVCMADRKLRGGKRYNSLQASGNTTISLTGILGESGNRVMIAAFEEQETVNGELCRPASHSDFKAVKRLRLDINGGYQKVGPDGQLKHSKMSESQFSNKLDTHGTLLTLTRQDQINDDLDAFVQINRQLGVMAALIMEEEFWKMVLANANAFFSELNKNLIHGTDYALSLPGLTKAASVFNRRVKSDGSPILISPKLMAVGTMLETTAMDLYVETDAQVTTTANKPQFAKNRHRGKYKPVVSGYLDNTDIKDRAGNSIPNQSESQYILFADPKVRAAFSCATLNGQQMPTIQSEESDFTTLGIQYRAFHDFGFGEEEPEAACMFTGVADPG
ncbi:hypothetical protein AB1L30_01300 [Bremerella sp. JC817]|uniref:phage major capsid protein n=1 Tax=Bremerella sp. JC817 TaxID=3231756 RepID=UPI003457F2DD